MAWRFLLAEISESLTGIRLPYWRANLRNIANHYGLHKTDWRHVLSAVRSQQAPSGARGWAADIRAIARARSSIDALGWRNALSLIHASDKPISHFWSDSDIWVDDKIWID